MGLGWCVAWAGSLPARVHHLCRIGLDGASRLLAAVVALAALGEVVPVALVDLLSFNAFTLTHQIPIAQRSNSSTTSHCAVASPDTALQGQRARASDSIKL